MKEFLRIPKIQLSICLISIYAIALISNFSYQALLLLVIVLASSIFSDFLFLKIRKKKLFFPSAAIVTSIIIVLLTDPTLPMYIGSIAAVSAMFSKNFIRFGRHIFNPAAFGLGFGSIVFIQTISWWAPGELFALSIKFPFLLLILFSPFLVSGLRMKKYFIILSFLFFYALGSMVFFQSTNNILSLIFDPTIIFFSLVIITEPMTTPHSRKNQILFGLFIAILAIFSSGIIYQIPMLKTLDPLIFALLLGNLIFFKNR